MNTIVAKEPWEFEGDDFSPSDPLYKISRPYRIWHEYLRLSPTFALAVKDYEYKIHKLTTEELKRNKIHLVGVPENLKTQGELTADEIKLIPDDYEDVVRTYKEMAIGGWDFSNNTFKQWWRIHAADIFGYRHAPSPISLISIPHGSTIITSDFTKALNDYSKGQRITDGGTGFVLVAVPLSGNKKDIMASINELIKEDAITPIKKTNEALFEIQKGKQLAKLPNGLRLLWMAALEPKLHLWKLGHKARVTEYKVYTDLDPTQSKHNEQTRYLTEYLASMTSTRLKEAVIIMENAARGRFPCKDAKLLPAFDKDEMIALVGEPIKKRQKQMKIKENQRNRLLSRRRKEK